MKVIVVGGGIAGLTLGLSLQQADIAVRVYEAVSDLAPLGVGINLPPAAGLRLRVYWKKGGGP